MRNQSAFSHIFVLKFSTKVDEIVTELNFEEVTHQIKLNLNKLNNKQNMAANKHNLVGFTALFPLLFTRRLHYETIFLRHIHTHAHIMLWTDLNSKLDLCNIIKNFTVSLILIRSGRITIANWQRSWICMRGISSFKHFNLII